MSGKQYVTIIGFTFRHLGDAGIDFFKGSGHGIVNNKTRLMVVQTKDGSDDNCFQNRGPEELVADFFFYQPYHKIDRYRTPVEHKQGTQLELRSRGEGGVRPPAREDRRPEASRGDHGVCGAGAKAIGTVEPPRPYDVAAIDRPER